MARAADSYPAGHWFDSSNCYQIFMGMFWFRQELMNTHETSRSYALNNNQKINGNIFSKIANRVKSLFTANAVALA